MRKFAHLEVPAAKAARASESLHVVGGALACCERVWVYTLSPELEAVPVRGFGLVAHPVRYGFFTFLRAALLKLCMLCKSTCLGPGLIDWVGWTTPRPGPAGADDPGMLQHSAVDPPIPPDDRGATGVWVGSRKSSRDDVPRSPLKQSGIGPARLGGRPAPLSRAWLLEAARRLFSLRRERTVPPLAPRAEGVQAGRERAAQPRHALLRSEARRFWSVGGTNSLC